MIAGSYTATLCIAPEFTGTIESFAAFLGVIANIASATTAGFINQTVIFISVYRPFQLD
jgi:hypothetical protein